MRPSAFFALITRGARRASASARRAQYSTAILYAMWSPASTQPNTLAWSPELSRVASLSSLTLFMPTRGAAVRPFSMLRGEEATEIASDIASEGVCMSDAAAEGGMRLSLLFLLGLSSFYSLEHADGVSRIKDGAGGPGVLMQELGALLLARPTASRAVPPYALLTPGRTPTRYVSLSLSDSLTTVRDTPAPPPQRVRPASMT